MKLTDTTKCKQAAALAAVNLPEIQPLPPSSTAPSASTAVPASVLIPASIQPAVANGTPAVKSEPTSASWMISRDPSPERFPVECKLRTVQTPQPSQPHQTPKPTPAIGKRPLLHPEPEHRHLPDPRPSKKRRAQEIDKPTAKRPKTNNQHLILSPGYSFQTTRAPIAKSDFMFPVLLEEGSAKPKWAACLLCCSAPSPKAFIYFKKLPLKKSRLHTHFNTSHRAFMGEQKYTCLDPDQKIAFIRKGVSTFDVFKNNNHIRSLESSPNWNCHEFDRLFRSYSSFADLRSFAVQNFDQGPAKSHEAKKSARPTATKQKVSDRPFSNTRKLLGLEPVPSTQGREKKIRKQLSNLFNQGSKDVKETASPSFCTKDPEHSCGRRNLTNDTELQSDIFRFTRNPIEGTLSGAIAYKNLKQWIRGSGRRAHENIQLLVLGDMLGDPLNDNSATANNAFLNPISFHSLNELDSPEERSGKRSNFRPLSVLTLFYLMRGVPCPVIAELVDAMTAGEQNGANERAGSILPLIVQGGNSMCAENLRLMRNALDEEHQYNWALVLLTRPCPELDEDGVEVLVAVRNCKMVRCDLHVVSVRLAEGIDDRILPFFDAICTDWKRRFVGINSGIDGSDLKRKAVERKLFEVLQAVEGVEEVRLIDKEVGRDGRPIFSDVVADMSDEDFSDFVDWHEKRFEKYLSKARLISARKALVQSGRVKDGYGAQPTSEPNNTDLYHNRELQLSVQDWVPFDELRDFAYTLKPLYEKFGELTNQSGCIRAGVTCGRMRYEKTIVDAGLERVFHARSLMKAWCMTKIGEGKVPSPKTRSQMSIWEDNWSNAMREVQSEKSE